MSDVHTCAVCGGAKAPEDLDRSTCDTCRGRSGKLFDLDVAIRAVGDSPERIREWPAIRHHLRERFGNLSDTDLWTAFTDSLAAKGLHRNDWLIWPFSAVPDLLSDNPWRAVPADFNGELTPAMLAAGVVVDSIQMPHGEPFEIWNTYVKVVQGDAPSACPHAEPPIRAELLPNVERRWRQLWEFGPSETIHWVGRQATMESLCLCYGDDGKPRAFNTPGKAAGGSGQTAKARSAPITTSRPSKANVNARMLEAIQSDPAAIGWNSSQWARYLGCAKSSAVETKSWKDLGIARERSRAERAKDRRRRPKASEGRRD